MKVNDSICLGKYNDENKCEDAIFINDNFICIIDGASSKTDKLFNGKKTGRICKEIIMETIPNISHDATGMTFFNNINKQLENWYKKENMYDEANNNPNLRISACMAVYSKYYNQIWCIGDIQILVDDVLYTNELLIDQVYVDFRITAYNVLKNAGITDDELLKNDISLKFLEPLMNVQNNFQNNSNSEYGYSILNGFELMNKPFKCIVVANNKNISMATDGYPKIFSSLLETENYLKNILDNDPLCVDLFKHFSGKYEDRISFDDRAYINFSI